ncbi:MAG: hypothetical protein H0X25_22660, partial [Acidobacteriales bacterium]|nr:hypothetical protein [Terriglobales bacterium]
MPQQLPKSARRILSALSILFALHLSVVASHAASINQNAYFQGDAGPYHLLVAIHTPESLPGQARVDLQLASGDADSVQVEPVRILDPERTESASSSQLIADSGDPRKFSGRVRLAASGSWALTVNIKGNAGEATTVIPFNAIAQRGGWPRPALLRACAGLLLLLLAVLATVKRRARSPRQPHGPRSWIAVPAISLGFLLAILLLTWGWIEAGQSLVHEPIFTAPALQAALARGNELSLQIAPSPASPQITSAPLSAYVAIIRLPQLDRFYT